MTRARDLASTALNSTVNTTELGYLDGVTSSVQTQLNGKKAETNSAISSNQTLVSGYRYFVDTAAARTLTLPASPLSEMRFKFLIQLTQLLQIKLH